MEWRGQVAAAVGGVAFLVLRGVLLWLVVPVGFIWWLVAWPWFDHVACDSASSWAG